MLNRLAYSFRVQRGKFVRKALRIYGVDLIKTPHLGDFLASRDCDLVIDVGANTGQFGHEVREMGYAGKMISFEPVASVFEHLKRNANWEVHNLALGAEPGSFDINVSQDTVFSSFKPLANGATDMFDIARVERTETVRVARLDDVLAKRPERNIFLKIDTQGFEREVLAGAPNTIEKCVGFLIEVPVRNIYNDTWGFVEAVTYFDSIGFEPAQIRPVSQDLTDPVCAIEFDCLFARKRQAASNGMFG